MSSHQRPRAVDSSAPLRLGLSLDEAAAAIGVSRDTFDRHIRHELRVVRRGRCLIVPIRELEHWLEREAARWAS